MKMQFRREKETKNTVRFQEVEQPGRPPVVGTLYVQKWAAADAREIAVEIQGLREPSPTR